MRKGSTGSLRRPAPPVRPALAAVGEEADADRPVRIAGLPAVAAVFARDPDRVERLFFDDRLKGEVGAFCRALAQRRRPYRLVGGEELARVAGTVLHGGVVAVTRPRPVPDFDVDAAVREAAPGCPLIILDGVGNPHNFGAIVRTAAFFGIEHVLVSDHPAQASPSEASYRVAEGGFEYVALARAVRLPRVLERLRTAYRVVGTAVGGGTPLSGLAGGRPVALVLGNEEAGLDPRTRAACDEVVTIPGTGQIESLNVSAAAAVLMFALGGSR